MKRAVALAAVVAFAGAVTGAASPRAPFITYWDPTWSPNGKLIAFVDRGDTPGDLYTMSPDGSNVRKLTNSSDASGDYGARNPTWSPDSKRIAFAYGYYGIVVANADGSHLHRLTKVGDMPAWSPRGRRIAFAAEIKGNGSSIYVVRPDGTKRQLVAQNEIDRSLFGPTWSPDGELLAFSVGTAADSEIKPGFLGIVSRYRGRARKVLRGLNPSISDWAPRGATIAVAYDPVTNDPAGLSNIRVGIFDLRTRRLRQLHFGLHPSWSPTGRRIAFTYKGDIWVMNANGTGAHRVTHRPT
jgi:Tol biopolymer transport system component